MTSPVRSQPAPRCQSHFSPLLAVRLRVRVDAVFRDEKETQFARSGENLRLRISGADDVDISPGFVLSSIKTPVPVVTQFEAQLVGVGARVPLCVLNN